MKKQLLLVVVVVMFVNAIVISFTSGCGMLLIPQFLAWDLVRVSASGFFADNHFRLVTVIGALFSGCFLAGVLALVALAARKRGLLVSQSNLAKMFAIATIIYLLIGALLIALGPCI